MRKTLGDNAPDLHVHSWYSLLDGTGAPEAVALRAWRLGWRSAALTEHGWLGSAPEFYRACRSLGINPILGCEMYVVPHDILGVRSKETRSGSFHLTVLALSKEGYQNLIAWNNASHDPDNFYYRPRVSLDWMVEHAPHSLHHNAILSGCMGGELCQTYVNLNGSSDYAGEAYVGAMQAVFPNFFIELQDHRIDKFMGRGLTAYEEMVEREVLVREKLVALAARTGTPTVLTNDSHMQTAKQRKSHMSMVASKMNSWRKEDSHGSVGASDIVKDYIYFASYMRSMEAIAAKHSWGEKSLSNMHDIAREANIVLEPLDNFTYSIPFSGRDDPEEAIRKRSKKRLSGLVKKHGKAATERFEHELQAMGDFKHYLLMMSDFIKHAHSQGILTNTRGSAANSLVCYCLSIHDIDPIEYKLIFSRFVNPERPKMPDVDVDIEADQYENFMRFVLQYVEEREGPNQCVQIGQYGTLANRSSFRLIAETLGIPKETQDEISRLLPQMIDSGMIDDEDDIWVALKEEYPDIYERTQGVFDAPKSVGQHACGWLIGTRDRPLSEWIPNYWISSSSRHVTQYNLNALDKFGLVKGDFLRLKTLAVVKRCLVMLGMDALDLEQIPLDDEETFAMLRKGKTEGIFTLQGNTNRQGCIECEVANVHDVIASVAIYRPALTRPGYHRVYNARRRGEETVRYPSDIAERVLGETYGLPIFQEQILELALGVGLSHAQSQDYLDAIKKAKGQGRGAREAFEALKPSFISQARTVMTKEEANGTWEFVGSFQGYGFNRGHATSYGRLAVRASYLKCHYPQEFYTSLLDVYPDVGRYVAGARAESFRIVPPSVNVSGIGFSKGDDKRSIRTGLARIKHVGPAATKELLSKRPFSSVDDIRERCAGRAVDSRTLTVLGEVGALAEFGVKPEKNETRQLELLSFLIEPPKALSNVKPKHARSGTSQSGWRNHGLYHGLDRTPPRSSVSKLFWIPEMADDDLLKLKASPWARAKSYLLIGVDINGIVFTIKAPEDKEESEYLKFIAYGGRDKKHFKGAAFCLDGAITSPFDRDGPLAFRLYDVTGAMQSDPQVWGAPSEKHRLAFNHLSRRKRAQKGKVAA